MKIKVVATDMDGTFLSDDKKYNKEKFKKVFEYFEENDIKFVAISGNQYYQIKTFFEDYSDKITIVGDNGSVFFENDQKIRVESMPNEVVETILHYLSDKGYDQDMLLDAEKTAYMLTDMDPSKQKNFMFYHEKVELVDSYFPLRDDNYTKFTFNTDVDETYGVIDHLMAYHGDYIQAVTSGNGNIDIINKGTNKGSAMKFLLDRWGYKPENLMAFGDGDNDLEMLDLAGRPYSMPRASENAHKIAEKTKYSNNEDGVLNQIIEYFDIEI